VTAGWDEWLTAAADYGVSVMGGDFLHGWPHIERVLANAALVNRELQGDFNVIRAAVLLHDTGHSEGAENHPERGARLAEAFLAGRGLDPATVNRVCECIRTHSRQYSPCKPSTPESKVLFDADGMDLFGPIGLARAILSAVKKEPSVDSIARKLSWRLSEKAAFYSHYARRYVKKNSRFIADYLEALTR
jgi:HD superfamily phosphodiesterase